MSMFRNITYEDMNEGISSFVDNVMNNKEKGQSLTEYVFFFPFFFNYIFIDFIYRVIWKGNPSMYDSIGGESMKSIRRNVFGVIIYHLGLIEYASNFIENRIKIQSSNNSANNNNSDPILSNLHKSLEPLLDHILNKHRSNNVDYETFQKDIFDKCNFLMQIEPAIKVNNEVLINNASDSIIPPSLNPNGLSAIVLHVYIYIIIIQ